MSNGQLILDLPAAVIAAATDLSEIETAGGISQKITRALIKNFMLGRATVQINDDDFTSFTAANSGVGGFILIHQVSGGAVWGMASFQGDGTAVMASVAEAAGVDFTTGALAGTTGVDGQLTVSIDTGGLIYIENRTGGVESFTYYTLTGG